MAAKFLKLCSGGCGRRRENGPDFFVEKGTGRPRPRCKHCMTRDAQQWNKRHPDKHKAIYQKANHRANIRKRFGLTVEQYDKLAAKHGEVCAVCKKPESRARRLSLDHCHTTGRIRGFLCCRCNLLIGGAADDPDILEAAARYLRNPPIEGVNSGDTIPNKERGLS